MYKKEHSVTVLLENRPDLLNRTVSLLHRRAFEVTSFSLGKTERDEVARLTVVVLGREGEGDRLARELRLLVQVIRVDASKKPSVARHHALVKIAADTSSRAELLQLCEVFRASVIDVARDCLMVEVTGEASKLAGFLEVVRPFGIIELVRTGPLSLGRAGHVLDTQGPEAASVSSWADHRSRIESTQWN